MIVAVRHDRNLGSSPPQNWWTHVAVHALELAPLLVVAAFVDAILC